VERLARATTPKVDTVLSSLGGFDTVLSSLGFLDEMVSRSDQHKIQHRVTAIQFKNADTLERQSHQTDSKGLPYPEVSVISLSGVAILCRSTAARTK
jgi:hypothetical protein